MSETLDIWILLGDGRREFVARMFDSHDEQFYSGQGFTPWIAVAWMLDERAHRRLGITRMAWSPGTKPTLTPSAADIELAMASKREPVRLPLAEAPCTKSKSAAARRARSKKSAKQGASH